MEASKHSFAVTDQVEMGICVPRPPALGPQILPEQIYE